MHLIIAIVITSVLTACASNGHHTDTAIMNRNAAKIESTLIVNAVPNHVLQAEIIHSDVGLASGAFMFGAIGGAIAGAVDATIDARRQKEADEIAAPLREILADYHFEDEMHQALESSIKPVTLLKPSSVTDIDQHLKKIDLQKKLKGVQENASLYVESSYALSPDFKQLHVSSKVQLFLSGYDLKQLFLYEADFKSKSLSGDDPLVLQKKWSANHGAQLKAAIREGIQKVGLQIRHELTGNSPADTPTISKEQSSRVNI